MVDYCCSCFTLRNTLLLNVSINRVSYRSLVMFNNNCLFFIAKQLKRFDFFLSFESQKRLRRVPRRLPCLPAWLGSECGECLKFAVRCRLTSNGSDGVLVL